MCDNRHRIRTVRQSFAQLAASASLSSTNALELRLPGAREALEVAVVYFRAGYTPNDYPTQREWDTRLLLERSRAIKCPSVALQLAGAKKVQQVLAEAGATEAFVGRPDFSAADAQAVRATYAGLYPLDDSPLGQEALRLARSTPSRFVLKPQREGGGNNIYRDDIPPFLASLDERDRARAEGEPRAREAYILMDLIKPPAMANLVVPAGTGRAVSGGVISELGIYGACLFRTAEQGAEILLNTQGGHLLRTKAHDVSEGGVATGFSVLDSPLLVD